MVPKLPNADIIEHLSDSAFQKRGIGLLITGPSRDERSTMANTVLVQFEDAGRSYLSLTPFEVVAAHHFGQSHRLCFVDVLLIKDQG